MLYVALQRPTEAIVWARRSPHPEVREGTAMQLEGRVAAGYARTLNGTRKLLETFGELPAGIVAQVVRPSVVPAIVLRSPVLARSWLEVMAPLEDKSPALAGAIVVLRSLRDGTPPPCDAADAALDPLRIELLHLCGESSMLIAEARRRDEVSFDERCTRFYLADAHLAEGNHERARELFAAVNADASLRAKQPVTVLLALERLGRLDELEGDAATARERYQQLVGLWGRVDVAVPEVDAARRRVAALGDR